MAGEGGVDPWAKGRAAWVAKCAAQTHCKHGHSLADAYVYNGRRKCRRCTRIRAKAWEQKKRAPPEGEAPALTKRLRT